MSSVPTSVEVLAESAALLARRAVVTTGWKEMSLGQAITLQRGFDLPHRNRHPGSVPIVSSSGISGFHDISPVLGPGVVTGRYGTIGEVFFLENDFWPLNTTLYIRDFKGNDPLYISYLLRTIDFHSHSGKSGVPGVNRNDLHGLDIKLPPPHEQCAIAAALSDVDALISGLDQLIAKKRDLKQAAMQQLLTGQRRLPGFNGEWVRKPFGELASPKKDRIDPKRAGAQLFCIEMEHIEPRTGHLLGSTVSGDQASLKSIFDVGDVLFGKLRAYLRKYWLADRKGVCSTEIWVLNPNRSLITSEFLIHIVTTDGFIEAASTSYGTHMPRSDWNIVKSLELSIPGIDEQSAIAAVLSDMDTELSALEARRDKTRDLKQGMMQELLTGRIRLV